MSQGESIDLGEYGTACNTLRRLLTSIGLKRVAKPVETLRERGGENRLTPGAYPASDVFRMANADRRSATTTGDDHRFHVQRSLAGFV